MEWLQVLTIVAAMLGVLGAQTTWIVHALERLETRLDSFEARVDVRFAQMDERFARMDERFARMEDRFARLEQDTIREHGERISRLEARLD